MALATNFTDTDPTATVHAAHHNAMAALLNQNLGPGFVYFAGRWYDQRYTITGSVSTLTPTVNTVYYLPTWMSRSVTIDRIACNTNGAGTVGATLRMGLYTSHPTTGLPNTQVLDAGALASESAASVLQVAVSTVVPQGLVYWAIATNATATGTMIAMAGTSAQTNVMGTLTVGTNPLHYLKTTNTGGVLPTSPPTTIAGYTEVAVGTNAPIVYYRIA